MKAVCNVILFAALVGVLFSNETVASLINDKFEPVWESVRPVPQVTIDFGNGTIVKRTLHGNVATYACTANYPFTEEDR